MNQRTENRIWRGLGLAAVAGLCIAATSQKAGPNPVSLTIGTYTSPRGEGKETLFMVADDRSLWFQYADARMPGKWLPMNANGAFFVSAPTEK